MVSCQSSLYISTYWDICIHDNKKFGICVMLILCMLWEDSLKMSIEHWLHTNDRHGHKKSWILTTWDRKYHGQNTSMGSRHHSYVVSVILYGFHFLQSKFSHSKPNTNILIEQILYTVVNCTQCTPLKQLRLQDISKDLCSAGWLTTLLSRANLQKS